MGSVFPIPEPPDQTHLPWYASNRSLPAYRFVPGLYPHPTRDPKGHSYNTGRLSSPLNWSPEQWETLEIYLQGVDLFNRFYFWEAHESWEGLWIRHAPEAEPAQFIQGLIQITAMLLKLHIRERNSAEKLWKAASVQLKPFHGKKWMGIEVNRFLKEMTVYLLPFGRGECPILGLETPRIQLD
ncbi:MAG: DUF309 domain-containing protein [Nitrospirae bacterium]|nr:DUF309 domain-containing protein [Nitrospirota bacterium]MBI3593361.1 DUF309 domain-containing protein [Nitrospirota bacterium]